MIRLCKTFLHRNYSISKRDIRSLNYLKTLSYPSLLKQLIKQSKMNNPKKNIINSDKYMLLSCFHECSDLYKIASQLSSKIQVNKDSKSEALMNTWRQITSSGLQHIFNMNTINTYSTYKNFIDFFESVKESITKEDSNVDSNIIYSNKVNQLFAFGIPEVFNLDGISITQKQKIKYGYVQTLYKLLQNLQIRQNRIQLGNAVHRLFPVQLFNKSDQSLIKDIYLRYMYPNMTEGSNNQIVWLGRFGLPCDRIIFKAVSKIKDDLIKIGQSQIGDKIEREMQQLCILSIIYHKLLNLKQDKHINSVKSTLQNSKLFRELTEIVMEGQEGKVQSFFQNIKEGIHQSIFQKERINNEMKMELFSGYNMTYQEKNNQFALKKISQLLIFQLLRFFLSLYNCYSENTVSPLNIKKLFSHPYVFGIIKSNIYEDNGFAEFFSEEQVFSSKFQLQLLEPQQKRFLTHVRNEYRNFIRRMSYDKHVTEKIKNINRRNNYIDHILMSHSRIKFDKFSAEQSYSQGQNQQRIAKSLINDNQFITFRLEKVIEDIVLDKLQSKLTITVQAVKNWQKYPYLPNLRIKGEKKKEQIYIKDIIREKPRMESQQKGKILQIGENTKHFNQVLLKLAKSYAK